ncbi:MAG TPA: transglycosylase SLT domain-containing protein, partial [Candidatus Eisenbacteria bacterium]|nr:transglycosylase SLT domain-containing protein [Candidatus Eisenbacteria bacterium]
MKQMLRHGAPVGAALVAVVVTSVAPIQHRASSAMRPVANAVSLAMLPLSAAVPSEPAGRVMRWENDRLLAAEAEQAAQRAAAERTAAARRAPAPAPIPSYAPGTVQDIITRAFTPYGSTAVAWGLRVAKCESGYNPRAYNPAGPYYGLFQFLMSTFRATPYGGQDIYDP